MIIFFGAVTVVFASGGLAIRKVEHYESRTAQSGPWESFVCGFYGRTRKTYTLPGVFLYWKKVRPFGFYLRYRGEPYRYSRIIFKRITLTTDNGRPIPLADDPLPFTRDLNTIQRPGVAPFSFFSHIFATVIDLPFEDVESIDFTVEFRIKDRWGTHQHCTYEGALEKISIDSVGRCR